MEDLVIVAIDGVPNMLVKTNLTETEIEDGFYNSELANMDFEDRLTEYAGKLNKYFQKITPTYVDL